MSGRAAQFGRSLFAEVSAALIAQFATRLEAEARAGGGRSDVAGVPSEARAGEGRPGAAGVSSDGWPEARRMPPPSDTPGTAPPPGRVAGEDLDVVAVMLVPLLRRAAVPAISAVAAGLVGLAIGRWTARRA